MVAEEQLVHYYALLMTVNVSLSLVVLVAACLWCRRKAPKNELLGLEGMVKLKNPDEVVVCNAVGQSESQADLNLSTVSNADSEKRASTAAHRSLPDIPMVEASGDNGSELYETVADKRLADTTNDPNKSPTPSLKKQTSVSQHSSISQADDVSSPYSRVRNSPHDYAKVRSTEHPYAQLNPPSTSAAAAAAAVIASGSACAGSGVSGPPAHNHSSQATLINDSLARNSQHSSSSQNLSDVVPQAEIPAASAIAGMISASQDLPYMTPPIAGQHFSGDSQDSSKGYTSISVREPLANILAQQPPKPVQRNASLARDVSDSHYATVSDDSDETYAAIEDRTTGRSNPQAVADIYTSGSETYAQIQPMQSNSIVVSVEINNTSNDAMPASNTSVNNTQFTDNSNTGASASTHHHPVHHAHTRTATASAEHTTPIPPPVDSLRAQMHSRQPSSSSNNSSSVGNLGSPKPEKRQANSPLPPTPKSNLTSGRNSVISVIECGGILETNSGTNTSSTASATGTVADGSPQKNKTKSLSPSKDIEGMYAKVMKKNKFSRHSPPSQSNSPVMTRKYADHTATLGVSPLDVAAAELMDTNKLNMYTMSTVSTTGSGDKSRARSNSYGAKDHGYETIPADGLHRTSVATMENRKSDCYANILQKERQQGIAHLPNPPPPLDYPNAKPPIDSDLQRIYHSEKHYETIAGPQNSTSNNDPGYETLLKPKNLSDPDSEKKSSDYDPNYEVLKSPKSAGLSDDGYAKVLEKKHLTIDEDSTDGYSKVRGEREDGEDGATGGYSTIAADTNHNYASILETKAEIGGNAAQDAEESDHYARIAEAPRILPPAPDLVLHSVAAPALVGVNGDADSEKHPPRLPDLPITSPSSVHSSSLLNNSSTISSTNALTSSSTNSTLSSRQTPSSASQYESLTGSDTDPNYESVCYLSASRENPYERLQPEYSDTQLSSPLTPEEQRQHSTTTSSAAATTTNSAATTVVVKPPAHTANGPKVNTSEASATDVVVDDYFQPPTNRIFSAPH